MGFGGDMRRCLMGAVAAFAVVAVSGACSADAPESIAETHLAGVPSGVLADGIFVASHEDSRRINLVTTGSSSCPVLPVRMEWNPVDDVLLIGLGNPAGRDQPCSADMSPTTSVLRLPSEAPDAPDVTVVIDGRSYTIHETADTT